MPVHHLKKKLSNIKTSLKSWATQLLNIQPRLKVILSNGYRNEFTDHYKAINRADAIIALNLEKKGIKGYVGAGVFAEIAFAVGLNRVFDKKIDVYYLNELPDSLPYSDELNLWKKLGWIKQIKKINHL